MHKLHRAALHDNQIVHPKSLAVSLIAGVFLANFVTVNGATAQLPSPSTSVPVLKDSDGTILEMIKSGQQAIISTTILNPEETQLPFVSILEVRNDLDVTVYLEWQIGTVLANGRAEIGMSWTPKDLGDYQIRTFIVSDFANPQILTSVAESRITVHEQEVDSILVLTDNSLLSLRGDKIELLTELDTSYSEFIWDGKNYYLATLQKPGLFNDEETFENNLLILNQTFHETSLLEIQGLVYDFAAKDGVVYLLNENDLILLDSNQEDPSFANTNRSISFEKDVHDIVIGEEGLYLLDNVVTPLFIHLVEIPSLKVHTVEFVGVNSHLTAQDISGDWWYVLEVMGVLNGYFETLHIFGSLAEKLDDNQKRLTLVSEPRGVEEDFVEDRFRIKSLKIDRGIAYAFGYGWSEGSQDLELKLGLYSLGDGRRLSLLELDEILSRDEYHVLSNILLKDGKLYLGGVKGVYVIDVSDPADPLVEEIIETEGRVRYLTFQ